MDVKLEKKWVKNYKFISQICVCFLSIALFHGEVHEKVILSEVFHSSVFAGM
jgi:hypothetical protein